MLTDEQLKRWRKLAEAATPGPWIIEKGETPCASPGDGIMAGDVVVATIWDFDGSLSSSDSEPDAVFIATAYEAVPALLDEVEWLRETLRHLLTVVGPGS